MKSFFHRVNKHSGSLKLLLYFFLISLPCRCVLHCIHSITVHFFFQLQTAVEKIHSLGDDAGIKQSTLKKIEGNLV